MIEILLMILLLLVAYGIGAYILRLFKLNFSSLEDFIFSVGLGFGVIAYLVFALGVSGLFYKSAFIGLIAILLVLASPKIKALFVRLWQDRGEIRLRSPSWFIWAVVLILLGHWLVNMIADLAPPTNGDTLHGYLLVPKIWKQHHKMVEIDYLLFDNGPGNILMLSTLGLLLKGDTFSQIIVGWLMGLLGVAAIFLFARRYFSSGVAWLAGAIFYCMPSVGWFLAHSAKIDLGWALFDILAIFAFFRYFEGDSGERKSWLVLSAVFMGFSMGSKYSSYSMPIICLLIFVKNLAFEKRSLWKSFGSPLVFAGVSLLIASPWYVRNYIVVGNPFFPILSTDTGLGPSHWLGERPNEGRGILGYFLALWNMGMYHMSGGNSVPAGPVFLAFLPSLIFLRKIDRRIKWMLLYSFLFSLLWYTQLQRTRHFLPALALLSIVTAYTAYRLMGTRQLLRRYVSVVLILIFGFNLLCTIKRNIISIHPIRYALGLETRDQFLERAFDGIKNAQTHVNYGMFSFINRRTEKSARIFAIGTAAGYYVDRPLIFGDKEILREKNVPRLIRKLRDKRINYVLFNPFKEIRIGKVSKFAEPELGEDPFVHFRKKWGNQAIFSDEFRDRFLKLVFSHNGQFLYRINFDPK